MPPPYCTFSPALGRRFLAPLPCYTHHRCWFWWFLGARWKHRCHQSPMDTQLSTIHLSLTVALEVEPRPCQKHLSARHRPQRTTGFGWCIYTKAESCPWLDRWRRTFAVAIAHEHLTWTAAVNYAPRWFDMIILASSILTTLRQGVSIWWPLQKKLPPIEFVAVLPMIYNQLRDVTYRWDWVSFIDSQFLTSH